MAEYINKDKFCHYLFKQIAIFAENMIEVPVAVSLQSVVNEIQDFQSEDVQPVKWIHVTERLPEENGRYLTVMHRTVDPQYRNELGDDDTEVRITRYYQGEWKVPLHSPKWINEAITDTVTHWMPLPEPPKDGET